MKRVYVTPVDQKIIPLPDGNGDLPQDGKDVAAVSYWYRRLADGDITMTEVGAQPEGKAAKSTSKNDTK
ncbi:DUF2635 domain-containing protein [Herminiimonas contaminans]|uniref:DUF2635 domain-containing protein n=1 Tax=Herminiimonas contaminans TaxID=1111140 RepID=A0ABS0EYZ3_9BURK|nr:DUF2635 domain-containing protein [Herminiimonas contaminans]MBF8179657.1 DUF2635 domain-containing protein [Herminiimonas contaminans]